jgi:hypothetical protein
VGSAVAVGDGATADEAHAARKRAVTMAAGKHASTRPVVMRK